MLSSRARLSRQNSSVSIQKSAQRTTIQTTRKPWERHDGLR